MMTLSKSSYLLPMSQILKLKLWCLILTTFIFFIRYISRLFISQIVRRLKQESTRQIWVLGLTSLHQDYWYLQIFWCDGYFVCLFVLLVKHHQIQFMKISFCKVKLLIYSTHVKTMDGFYGPFYKNSLS